MIRFLLAILILFSTSAGFAQAWDMNEISVLMPLPQAGTETSMWSPKTAGGRGELLPDAISSKLPRIVLTHDPQQVYSEMLKVIALRIDPCFQEGQGVQPCRRQVRLVWQPVVAGSRRVRAPLRSTLDAAVHTFYELDESSWTALIGRLSNLKRRFPVGPGLPLQVHPILRQQGYGGTFWPEFSAAVLPAIGAGSLLRVTVMTVNPRGNTWVFTGFDISGGQMNRMAIPRITTGGQAFFSGLQQLSEFRADMNPRPEGEERLQKFLIDSATFRSEQPEAEVIEVVRKGLIFENPQLSNSGTVDCASCHGTRALSVWAQTNFPNWPAGSLFEREQYRGPGNLTNTSVRPLRSNVLRIFGYFDADPIIAQRTINETSMALAGLMNSRNFRLPAPQR